ncbi:MAG: hypothetical protein ABIL58_14080 [Pseudomonadota bacterium]
MSDFDDDFGDYDDGGFGDDGGMDDDSMEDQFDEALPGDDMDEPEGPDDEMPAGEEADADGLTGREVFYLGSAMGWAYEEGREEAERRRLLKKGWREGRKKG